MYPQKLIRWPITTLVFTALIFLILISPSLFAESQDEYPFSCKDVLFLFARGSDQNKLSDSPRNVYTEEFKDAEPESYTFFNWFKTHLDNEFPHVDYKAISIHSFPGKYSGESYRAVSVKLPHIANDINSEASWFPGEYRKSVDDGVKVTSAYLKDQIHSCPEQSIVVGGYSQGAQVMGDALFELTSEERSKILGVGLFGDPKYIGTTDAIFNPLHEVTSFPWRRGDATNKDSGMLDPRVPYVPNDIGHRVASYCFRSDFICAGYTGVRKDLTAAHGGYSGEPMRNTVNEIMMWSFPKLAEYERQRGGTGLGPNASYGVPDNNQRDIMFVINDDSNTSVLQTLRYQLDPTMYGPSLLYPNTRYAAKGTGESDDGVLNVPRVENIQSFAPYTGYDVSQPMFSVSNLAISLNKRYPFGQPIFGSGDYPNPLGLAVEKGVFSAGWREDSIKHLVLFTDRPVKEVYSYNICHDTTRTRLQIPKSTYNVCAENLGNDSWPKSQHPEVCETVYLAITKDTCTSPLKTPSPTQMINRTLNDEIIAAQSQKIAVDVVVPFNILPRFGGQAEHDAGIKQLKYFAESTGGKFIYYDKKTQYDTTAFSDTLYQIFGHTPKPLVLAYKDALDGQGSFNTGHVLGAITDRPIILDASQSNQSYDHYQWDFNNDGVWDETSGGPVVEHQFTAPMAGFIRVAGTDSTSTAQSETRLAVTITEPEQTLVEPTPPTAPEVTGTTEQNGDIALSWQASEVGTLLFIDPDSHLPVAQAPTSSGSMTFTPEKSYVQLEVRLAADDLISDAQTIIITPYTSPVVEELPITESDPTLCYKLQTCQNESAPPDSYNPQEVSTSSLNNTQGGVLGVTSNATPVVVQDNSIAQQKNQQSVQGISTEPSLTSETYSQIDNTINQTKTPQNNYHLQQIGLGIFVLGGFFLLYRISKLH